MSMMVSKAAAGGTALIAALLLLPNAAAEDIEQPGGIFTFTLENDLFTGSDDRFTNGLNFTWTSRELTRYRADGFIHRWGDFWSFAPGANRPGSKTYVAWSLSQEMHTPSDISREVPDPNDQPYAGLLLLDSTLYTLGEHWGQAWNLQLGVVGPATGASDAQEWFHQQIGTQDPKGWDSQIQNEPLFNIGYTGGFELVRRPSKFGADIRVTPLFNAELGTHFTAAGASLLFEYGWNLPEALSVGALGMNLHAVHTVGAEPTHGWAVSTYASFGGYAIGHYLPLDGPVFRDGPSVEYDGLATAFSFGFTARRNNVIAKVGITHGATPADSFDEDVDFGIISVSWIR